jgi:phytoene dehydrogenase-like protein
MADIVVVGGGLAGLTVARHLAAAGRDVELLEQRASVGGRVRSRRERGFVLDRGFQVLFTSYPAARRELDLDALSLRPFSPGATIARPGNRSVLADPLREPRALLATLLNPNARFGDALRVLALQRELASKSREAILAEAERESTDSTIGEYLAKRGFSRRFVETFFAPFYGGITLDRSLGTSKAVFEYTFKALAEGEIVVPAEGMGAITDQLAARSRAAGASITLDTTVKGIDATETGATVSLGGETIDATAVVVATDPPAARELTGVESVPTGVRGCVTQQYSLPTSDHPNTGTRLVLNAHNAYPNTVAPLSTVAPEYAPSGRELLSATFLPRNGVVDTDGRNDVFGASDADLADSTRRTLSAWYPEHRFDRLETIRTDRLPFSQFAQPPGFRGALPTPGAPDGRAYLAGEYTGWSSINAALDSGRRAARSVLADV